MAVDQSLFSRWNGELKGRPKSSRLAQQSRSSSRTPVHAEQPSYSPHLTTVTLGKVNKYSNTTTAEHERKRQYSYSLRRWLDEDKDAETDVSNRLTNNASLPKTESQWSYHRERYTPQRSDSMKRREDIDIWHTGAWLNE
jgi:hypothetical protein